MNLYYDIYKFAILFNEVCKICMGVLLIRLILLISKWVKTAYQERNVWETVEEEIDKE